MRAVTRLERHDNNRNMHRYYSMYVTETLFGTWALVRTWGRVGSRHGQRSESWYSLKPEASRAALRAKNGKMKRGYQVPISFPS
jgi:predicted DNA-binding WGR domain protein